MTSNVGSKCCVVAKPRF